MVLTIRPLEGVTLSSSAGSIEAVLAAAVRALARCGDGALERMLCPIVTVDSTVEAEY